MKPREWHQGVFDRDHHRCAASEHHSLCKGQPHEAHHIVYKSHLTKASLWVLANGIALSTACHVLAHKTHNGNIDQARLVAAVNAVNAAMDDAGDPPELRRPHFRKKATGTGARSVLPSSGAGAVGDHARAG